MSTYIYIYIELECIIHTQNIFNEQIIFFSIFIYDYESFLSIIKFKVSNYLPILKFHENEYIIYRYI